MTLGGLLNFVRKSQFFDQDSINRLYQESHEDIPPIKGDIVNRRIVLGQELRERSDNAGTAVPDFELVNERGVGITQMDRKRPETVKSNPLTFTENGGTLSYIDAEDSSAGGGMGFDGSTYLSIANHTLLQPASNISIVGWFYLPASSGTHQIIHRTTAYLVRLISGNTLQFLVRRSSGWTTRSFSYTPDTWFHLACTYSGSQGIIYENGIVVDSSTFSNQAMQPGSGDVGVGATGVGGNILMDGARMSHLSVINNVVSSSWVTDHMNGLLDTSDGNDEIFTFPFTGTSEMLTDASSGECRST